MTQKVEILKEISPVNEFQLESEPQLESWVETESTHLNIWNRKSNKEDLFV